MTVVHPSKRRTTNFPSRESMPGRGRHEHRATGFETPGSLKLPCVQGLCSTANLLSLFRLPKVLIERGNV